MPKNILLKNRFLGNFEGPSHSDQHNDTKILSILNHFQMCQSNSSKFCIVTPVQILMVLAIAMVFIFCILVAMLVFQKWLIFTIDRLQQIYVKCSHKTSVNVHGSQVHLRIVGNIGQEHREPQSIHYARWIYIRGSVPPSVDPSVRWSVCKSFVSDLASYGVDISDALVFLFFFSLL